MAARKRASSDGTAKSTSATRTQNHKFQEASIITTTTLPSPSSPPPIAPPAKAGQILKVSLIFFLSYFYLVFYHYGTTIEAKLKRSILINAILSFTGFFLTLVMIPVASRYVLRRNMFGFDINKKGTPQSSVKA